jgi:hypothetical protein
LAGTRDRKTMQFEGIGRVTVGHFRFEIGRQVDDVDGTKGTLLGTDTTTNTKLFRDEGNFGGSFYFDTEFA